MFCQCFYLGPLGLWSCFLLKEVVTLLLKDPVSSNSGHLLWLWREKQRSLLQAHLVPGVNLNPPFWFPRSVKSEWLKQLEAGRHWASPCSTPIVVRLNGQGSFHISREYLWNQSLSRQDLLLLQILSSNKLTTDWHFISQYKQQSWGQTGLVDPVLTPESAEFNPYDSL